METLTNMNRAVIEFELEWQSKDAHHVDAYWADPVNFWRDILKEPLFDSLIGKTTGQKVSVEIPKETFHTPHNESRIVSINPSSFKNPHKPEEKIVTKRGRYYPQGFLHGVSGVFSKTTTPCRFIGLDNDLLRFDLNHPLSTYDLTLHATIHDIYKSQVERGGRCEDWLEKISTDGPGMQALASQGYDDFFTAENLRRLDQGDDKEFYNQPRFVQHLDRYALDKIEEIYSHTVGPDSKILDLMASWDSHLPLNMPLKKLSLLGLNEEELLKNDRGNDTYVQDLNLDTNLPYPDKSYDAVICTASIEYLTKPVQVCREVNRILRDDGIFIVTFSNRWFPSKAVNIWKQTHEFERLGFVLEIFRKAGNFKDLHTYSRRGLPRPDDDPHHEIPLSDPVFAVWGKKRK